MSNQFVPYSSTENVEAYRGLFLVPADWISCGVVVHVAGIPGMLGGQPVALAITNSVISLCTEEGPTLSMPLGSIRDVKVIDLTGIALPIRTPSGIVEMAPNRAKGVSLKSELNPMGNLFELTLYTLSPTAAYEWINAIQEAIFRKLSNLGRSNTIPGR